MGYQNSENTWEKVANLSGAKKMIDEFDKKDVEKIVGETFHKGETWFMVKWKGYKSEKNTWEPEESLKETAQEAIAKWAVDKVKKAEKKAASDAKKEARKAETKAKR